MEILVAAIFIIGLLFFAVIYMGVLLYKSGYLQPQKRKREELDHINRMNDLERKYNSFQAELERSYRERIDRVNAEVNSKRERQVKELREFQQKELEAIDLYRREQEQSVAAQLDKFKVENLKKTQQEIEKEVMEILQKKKERMELINLHFEEAELSVNAKLEDLKSLESAAIAARIRQYEEANKELFYKINIQDEDIEEIKELESIVPKLRNPIPLRQAIYNIYYKDAVRDMISRVCGQDRRTGIYKITYIETGQCYIGQSVDIANR
jgi:hypothetical protein